jgi:hypothetical protein
LKANPDSLAWGNLHRVETLFWLEVESGHSSRHLILDKTPVRWLKATGYADTVGIRFDFVLLAMPWVRDAARLAFVDLSKNVSSDCCRLEQAELWPVTFSGLGEVVV